MNKVKKFVRGIPASDGAGVQLTRVLGQPGLKHLDPFLLLDEFKSDEPQDYLAGFPPHPHRGFETVTYMLNGHFKHKDNQGNEGHLRSGDIQWMTAGRGIVHEEMPMQEEGLVWGFQLWVNLPAEAKLCAPKYQDVPSSDIPEREWPGGKVRVLVGSYLGLEGPVSNVAVNPTYLDVQLNGSESYAYEIPEGQNGFVYLYQGEAEFAGQKLSAGTLAAFEDGSGMLEVQPMGVARLLIVHGHPTREPIVQYGPFVMNTVQEVEQAIQDFNEGRF